jgi:hypothetical protein
MHTASLGWSSRPPATRGLGLNETAMAAFCSRLMHPTVPLQNAAMAVSFSPRALVAAGRFDQPSDAVCMHGSTQYADHASHSPGAQPGPSGQSAPAAPTHARYSARRSYAVQQTLGGQPEVARITCASYMLRSLIMSPLCPAAANPAGSTQAPKWHAFAIPVALLLGSTEL